MTHEQLALVWMAAFAFNMGIAPREDRTPETVAEMRDALRAMRDLFNITIAEDQMSTKMEAQI